MSASFAVAVDAPIAPLVFIVGHRRRATEQRCSGAQANLYGYGWDVA